MCLIIGFISYHIQAVIVLKGEQMTVQRIDYRSRYVEASLNSDSGRTIRVPLG